MFVHSCYNETFIGIRENVKLIFTWMIDQVSLTYGI